MLERKMESAALGDGGGRGPPGRLLVAVQRAWSNYDDAGASAFGIGRYTGRSSVVVRQAHIARIMQHVLPAAPVGQHLDEARRGGVGVDEPARPHGDAGYLRSTESSSSTTHPTSRFMEQERWADPVQAASYQAMRMSLGHRDAERAVEEHATRNFRRAAVTQLVDMDDETHTRPWQQVVAAWKAVLGPNVILMDDADLWTRCLYYVVRSMLRHWHDVRLTTERQRAWTRVQHGERLHPFVCRWFALVVIHSLALRSAME